MKATKFAIAMLFAPLGAGLLTLTGCGSEPATVTQQKQLVNDSTATLKNMELADASLSDRVSQAAGYVVFPDVGKGGFGIEVASGNGDVYMQGNKYLGTAHLGMVGAGANIGGEDYQELILFETPAALNEFENNRIKFDASTSAVALQAGTAATAKFDHGMLVFTHTTGGLMVEANVGGQQFTFKAANAQPTTQP